MSGMITAISVGVPWTIALTIGSFLIGAILGLPLCAMRMSNSRLLSFLAAFIVVTFRSIPPLLWVFILYFGLGSGYLSMGAFQSAILALGLISAANMSEIYRGSISAIHHGQWDAARALGLPVWSRYGDVIGPQLLRVSLPSSASYAVGLLKNSSIASTIGVAEIAFNAHHLAQSTFRGLEVYAIAGMLYILISLPIAALARVADARLRARVAL